MAVTHFLNAKSGKSERVMMFLVRQIVLWSLQINFIINSSHVRGSENQLTDAISRMQWDKFRALGPEAIPYPAEIPTDFLKLLPEKYSVLSLPLCHLIRLNHIILQFQNSRNSVNGIQNQQTPLP